ncbi:MAG: TetR/AcrR family transcriptional regulator [Ahrensia sp.]|nr:TetR/AcrR family transcriptional regulator [Ahrensia sp.]
MSDESQSQTKRDRRRRQILGATMRLVSRYGTGISTAQIAAAASCSKETLYNWFDDRDGLFLALIEEQARSMGAALDRAVAALGDEGDTDFETRLTHHAIALLDIMTGDAVIVVNRVAMSQCCVENQATGSAVLTAWDEQIRSRFEALIGEAAQAGLVAKFDPALQFDGLVGLLIGDRQRRILLGAAARPKGDAMRKIAREAVRNWLLLNKP